MSHCVLIVRFRGHGVRGQKVRRGHSVWRLVIQRNWVLLALLAAYHHGIEEDGTVLLRCIKERELRSRQRDKNYEREREKNKNIK